MLKRDPIIDDLFRLLSDWAKQLETEGVEGAFLFGSTINEDGVRFDPISSDIDVVLVVNWNDLSFEDRAKNLDALRLAKASLELNLFRKLQRSDGDKAIVSLIPVTRFELTHSVHKDGASRIMDRTTAYDLVSEALVTSMGGGGSNRALAQEHRSCLQFIQKKRVEALSVTPNGKGGLKVERHSDPVPKELMRQFAVATADLEQNHDITDLARGLDEIRRFADKSAASVKAMRSFKQWLGVRQGDRGNVDPTIQASHYTLLVEGLFDGVLRHYAKDQVVVPSPSPAHRKNRSATPEAALSVVRIRIGQPDMVHSAVVSLSLKNTNNEAVKVLGAACKVVGIFDIPRVSIHSETRITPPRLPRMNVPAIVGGIADVPLCANLPTGEEEFIYWTIFSRDARNAPLEFCNRPYGLLLFHLALSLQTDLGEVALPDVVVHLHGYEGYSEFPMDLAKGEREQIIDHGYRAAIVMRNGAHADPAMSDEVERFLKLNA